MINLFHVAGTRAFRVIWLCEELRLPYTLTRVDFSPQYRASPEWRRMNPVGKVPVMTDGDLTMFESGAMVQYVLDRYGDGRLQPAPGTAQHGHYLQWSWFAEATFARPVGEIANHRRAFGDDAIDRVVAEMEGRARLCLEAVDNVLADCTYLLGDTFSAADIMMGYTVMLAEHILATPLPHNVSRYWTALQKRQALQATREAEQNMSAA